jgi:hypothetical protein
MWWEFMRTHGPEQKGKWLAARGTIYDDILLELLAVNHDYFRQT